MKQVDGIRYLVTDWIPYSMLSMILAPPGYGKSAFALYGLMRPIIVGNTKWFTGKRGPRNPGYVLLCDTEGTAAITVQRTRDWNLPANRIKVPYADDLFRSINLSNEDDLQQIEAIINEFKIKLCVIDSLRGSHGGDENSSKIAEVLGHLASIAERTKAAIVLIHHTRKLREDEAISPDSSRGSNAIMAMVRSQIGFDKPDSKSDWLRMQMLKENLGMKPEPIGFRISRKGLEFGEAPRKEKRETKKDQAAQWLQKNMKPKKWHEAKELREDAKAFGFSESDLQRARKDLGIVQSDYVKKFAKIWKWRLPPRATGMKKA